MDIGKLLLRVSIGVWATWLRVEGQSMCSELNVTIDADSAVYVATSTYNDRSVFEGDDTTLWWMWFTESTVAAHSGCDSYPTPSSAADYYWHLGIIGGYGYLVGDCADHPADISSTAIWEYYSSDGVLSIGVDAPKFSCIESTAQPTPAPSSHPPRTSAPTSSSSDAPSSREDEGDADATTDDDGETGGFGEGFYRGVLGGVGVSVGVSVLACVLGLCGCFCWTGGCMGSRCRKCRRRNRVGHMEARRVTVRAAAGAGSAPSERDSPTMTTSSNRSSTPRGGNEEFLSTDRGVVRPAEAATLVHTAKH